MPTEIPWRKTLGAKLAGIGLALLGLATLFSLGTFYMLSSLKGDANWLAHSSDGRAASYQVLDLARRLLDETAEDRKLALKMELSKLVDDAERRPARLREGDPALGIPPAT